jgi:VWFA-related protein
MKGAISMPARIPYPAQLALAAALALALAAALALALAAPPSARSQVEANIPEAGFGPPAAQPSTPTAGQPDLTTPTIHIYSRETLVDITVTDDKGHPVHGLTRSDFTITEDGAPQPIRSFQEFGTHTPAAAPQPLPKLPPNVYTNLQAATGPLTVLLLDDINGGVDTNDGGNGKARLEIAASLKRMPAGTRVALIALGARLTILQGPTSDPAQVLRVINNSVDPFFVEAVGCTHEMVQNRTTLDQLNELANYLSGIKGRKNVIWIGSGIISMIFPSPCKDYTRDLRQTYDLLGDAEITVYPLDPHALEAPFPSGVSGPIGSSSGAQVATGNMARMTSLSVTHLTLEAVAEATGGQAIYNTNDIAGAIAGVADSGSSYYTLSYVPPSLAYDGRYHAINVKLDKPGLHLVYRKGYSAEDPALIQHTPETLLGFTTRDTRPTTPAAHPLSAVMGPIAPPATQLLFDVKVEPSTEPPSPTDPPILGALNPKLSKAPLTRYGFLFAVPASQIAFTSAADGNYTGSLEFDVAAYDPDGRLVTIRSQTMQFPLTAAEYRQFIATPFQFFQELDLPPGPMTVRAGVLDGVSNKVGTLEIPLTVPKNSTAR